jgi:hypothetical protein
VNYLDVTAAYLGVAVVLAIGITTAGGLVRELIPNLAACLHPAQHVQWNVAHQLLRTNLTPGDRVAVLGHSTVADYWAHLAGLRIVADVPIEGVPIGSQALRYALKFQETSLPSGSELL